MRATARRRRAPLAAAILFALAAALCAGAWHATRPVAVHPSLEPSPGATPGPLHVDGGRIVDAEGRAVLLRGFNESALLDTGPRSTLDESDAELMREEGFDVVRLPVAWSSIEPEPGRYDLAYLARVRAAVELFGRHGIWTIVDMHFGIAWGPRSNVPGWARVTSVPELLWYPTAPWRYSLSPRAVASEVYFWTRPDWQGRLAGAWRALAAELRTEPYLAGYDLYNEPHPLPIPPLVFSRDYLFPLYAKLVTAIGSVDAGRLFILESTLFDSFPTPTERFEAPGVVYSPHLYTGSVVNAPWHRGPPAQMLGGELDQRLREAARLPAPVLVGELGFDATKPDAATWTRAALQELGRRGLGWTWWQWRQDGGWGVRDLSGRVDQAVLRRLAQPYVRAAPGGLEWSWDGRSLSLQGAAGQTAEVSWPADLPSPRASGGCQLSGSPPELSVRLGGACRLEG